MYFSHYLNNLELEDCFRSIATQYILGASSLWLLMPIYVGSSHLTENLFGLCRLGIMLCTTCVSIVYWGYYNDEKSIALFLDMNFARLTAIVNFLYALCLSFEYALIGSIGTLAITRLYIASHRASLRKAQWTEKLSYHLLFRYVGFWVVFILHARTGITSFTSWALIFITTSVVYFGHAFIVFATFSPAIRYEVQLVIASHIVLSACAFTHCL
jgi:hypothetical protein